MGGASNYSQSRRLALSAPWCRVELGSVPCQAEQDRAKAPPWRTSQGASSRPPGSPGCSHRVAHAHAEQTFFLQRRAAQRYLKHEGVDVMEGVAAVAKDLDTTMRQFPELPALVADFGAILINRD